MFLEELLSVLHNEKSVDTYIGNIYARYEFIDRDNVTIHAQGDSFNLDRKQIEKLKSKIEISGGNSTMKRWHFNNCKQYRIA
jgi:hypothetical protein